MRAPRPSVGPGPAAQPFLRLDENDRSALEGRLTGCGESGEASADDDDVVARAHDSPSISTGELAERTVEGPDRLAPPTEVRGVPRAKDDPVAVDGFDVNLAFDDPDVLVGLEEVRNGRPVGELPRLDAVDPGADAGAADELGELAGLVSFDEERLVTGVECICVEHGVFGAHHGCPGPRSWWRCRGWRRRWPSWYG